MNVNNAVAFVELVLLQEGTNNCKKIPDMNYRQASRAADQSNKILSILYRHPSKLLLESKFVFRQVGFISSPH